MSNNLDVLSHVIWRPCLIKFQTLDNHFVENKTTDWLEILHVNQTYYGLLPHRDWMVWVTWFGGHIGLHPKKKQFLITFSPRKRLHPLASNFHSRCPNGSQFKCDKMETVERKIKFTKIDENHFLATNRKIQTELQGKRIYTGKWNFVY